ncbi:MAG: hypothetical protein WA125_06945, partial [Desulfosporosinus sp.]
GEASGNVNEDDIRRIQIRETIFSHSALREGWDKPNVFQICTLKHSDNATAKRQEVGRGLRLCVNNTGEQQDTEVLGDTLVHGVNIALILFMFDAIRNDAKLVILDDPIFSFDSNKKYAIINRLFKTGEKGDSLYERTVLMLTRDFEPVIDYIQTNSGRQKPTSVCANYFENKDGRLQCTPICKDDDLMSSVVLLKELAQCLMERYATEASAYIKMLILRAYTEQDAEARVRLRKHNDVLRKYVDETYHIENDYLYSLDVRRFNIVPDNYIADVQRYVADESARFDFATE